MRQQFGCVAGGRLLLVVPMPGRCDATDSVLSPILLFVCQLGIDVLGFSLSCAFVFVVTFSVLGRRVLRARHGCGIFSLPVLLG